MHVCPYCGEPFRAGELFCGECGHQLHNDDSTTIANRGNIATPALTTARELPGRIPSRDDYEFMQLYIQDAQMPVLIEPCKRTLVGRFDNDSDQRPHVDLTAYGAREKGVSRIHAAIECHEDAPFIIDLDSTNGVFINGVPLARGTAHILHDGDEVVFGRLMTHIYFE